ncbi:MAG: recombinase family protein [Patescibacteria group bacterium]
MNLAYSYGRVSTDEQASHGYSVDNQKLACKNYAQVLEYEIAGEFFDEGKTGRNTHRDEYQAMMQALDKNPVNAIIVFKLDRIFRSTKDFSNTIELLKKKDVKLLSTAEGDVTGGVLGGILSVLAQHESETIGMRTKAGMNQKFLQGYFPGQAPLGYRNITRDERKIIEPDPTTAPIIKKMFEMYATGQYSQLELCEVMYEKGLRGKRNKTILSPQTLTGIFNSPLYYGWMRWGKQEAKGNHEPLITKSLFDQVQHVLACNNSFLTRKRSRTFLLRGFVYCPIHERRLVADYHDLKSGGVNKTISYYHCSNRGGCKPSYNDTKKLEKQVANLFKQYEFSPEFIELVQTQAKEHIQNSRTHQSDYRRALLDQKRGLTQRRRNIEDLLVDKSLDRDIFKRQYKQLQEELGNIERKVHQLDNEEQVDFSVIEEVLALTRNLHQTYLDAPEFLQRHYLRLFFDKIYVKDKKIVKVSDTPIFSVLKKENKILLRETWGRVREYVRTLFQLYHSNETTLSLGAV